MSQGEQVVAILTMLQFQ